MKKWGFFLASLLSFSAYAENTKPSLTDCDLFVAKLAGEGIYNSLDQAAELSGFKQKMNVLKSGEKASLRLRVIGYREDQKTKFVFWPGAQPDHGTVGITKLHRDARIAFGGYIELKAVSDGASKFHIYDMELTDTSTYFEQHGIGHRDAAYLSDLVLALSESNLSIPSDAATEVAWAGFYQHHLVNFTFAELKEHTLLSERRTNLPKPGHS